MSQRREEITPEEVIPEERGGYPREERRLSQVAEEIIPYQGCTACQYQGPVKQPDGQVWVDLHLYMLREEKNSS